MTEGKCQSMLYPMDVSKQVVDQAAPSHSLVQCGPSFWNSSFSFLASTACVLRSTTAVQGR
eukprot:5387463-Pleurochrysis_carterae.AAC.1